MHRYFTAAVILIAFARQNVLAHDIWINRGSYRNPAGEWCCGAEDCGVISPGAVKAVTGDYSVRGFVTYGVGVTAIIGRSCWIRVLSPQRGPLYSWQMVMASSVLFGYLVAAF